ncbi:MAG: hypothetical protein IFK94_13740 [Acidobacteria bacterium]|uniref:Cellobiose phosphorylase n=1 Tax=Candidatus Polarisedimenticola svalbardensis TaxID=2886004 RepID=A0A8J7CF97_9BACT|nr:hypothetical protein [Candidatus Polarisedimenticola svalbardensis]
MTERRKQNIFLGESAIRVPGGGGGGAWVDRDGERFYRISGYHTMPPFFMSVVSGYDHWLFVSSTGGLTCGRRDPENALFPYCTDDKIHDACATTGPMTALLVARSDKTLLWQPFANGPLVYNLERNLYRNVPGNKLVFEEVNHDLGLTFTYTWTSGNRFGFIRKSQLINTSANEARVELLDGLRNLLPYGVDRGAQAELSTLVDAYKQAEAVTGATAGIYTLSSILTDRAEPSEALKASVVWSTGLEQARVLLSESQVQAFCEGEELHTETAGKGTRGAFFVQSTLTLPPQSEHGWYLLADVEQGPSQLANLLDSIRQGVTSAAIEQDVADNTARLGRLAGSADGFQKSSDEPVTGRHFSNTLFNIMRGGVFPHGYRFPRSDFLDFVRERNLPLRETVEAALANLKGPLTLDSALQLAEDSRNKDFTRLVYEYLPLTFSRRHGDPSRPWNHFSIDLEKGDGSEQLSYQGNWRDIFQNWEALALSFPGYIESFIAKFVNASTADGHNPYRISREGIDWEILDPDTPWSNIGYWGDHQVGYLLRLLELSLAYHPGRLAESLDLDLFVYADVPYRIKPYRELIRDPRDTVEYDDGHAQIVAGRVAGIGGDGKLATLPNGSIYRVNLVEKLLLAALVRIGNLVPGGGIWMNTQRPEWNDANNALVGYGLSMVTLCYLRRYLRLLEDVLHESPATGFGVSRELTDFLKGAAEVLNEHRTLLDGPVSPAGRKSFMDGIGSVNDKFRARVYRGFSGEKATVGKQGLLEFTGLALEYLDHSIAHGRRADGLFHAYNLVRFDTDGYDVEPLDEMLEGQVAVLSSGHLDAEAALALLEALRASRLYRPDQNSYMLYPNRTLPSFLDKNVIPETAVKASDWIRRELAAGRTGYVEGSLNNQVHFNGVFKNADDLRAALEKDPAVGAEDAAALCDLYEAVFEHRRFTGRSGSMYKYEGLGCIYWHMVSKLLLATGEVIAGAVDTGADAALVDRLGACFRDIRDGLGMHKSPAEYGAFPVDPYSHTPEFTGVQQPGLTGQVKEDLITRFRQLGVRVSEGQVTFEPVLLHREEFLTEPTSWIYSTGGPEQTEELPARSLAFMLCGVPVIYRMAESAGLQVFGAEGAPTVIDDNRLGPELSQSLFRREPCIRKLVVDLPEAALR